MSQLERNPESGPFAEARAKLFPPLRNKILSQAAGALADDRPDMAEPLVARVLERNPGDADALNLMADIARRAHRFEDAERLLARCIASSPHSAGCRFNYAIILRRLERFEDSLAQLDELLVSNPQNPLYRDQTASVLHQLGRHADALALRQGLAEEYPQSAEIWLEYAHALRSAGFGRECVAAYHKSLQLSPSSIAAYSHLANLKTYRFTQAEMSQMEILLARPGSSAEDRADLHFALGKAFGDEALYARSFDNYAKGNALRRMGAEYDPECLAAYRRVCENLFSQHFFAARAGWGSTSEAPIFIVGMPRSGSTLVEQILSSHTAIEGLGELADLDSVVGRRLSALEGGGPSQEFWIGGQFAFRRALSEALPRALNSMNADEIRSLGDEYLDATSRRRTLPCARFTDKGLRNFGFVGLIALILPNARIIDVRRHPLDCGWSCFRSDFPGGQPFAHRLADVGRVYAEYAGLMAHFDRVLPGGIYRMFYENLVSNPEPEVRRLLRYLGLPFEDQCLRFHETGRAVHTLSSEQVRTPLYASGIGQWRHYETWLGPLKGALGSILENYPETSADSAGICG